MRDKGFQVVREATRLENYKPSPEKYSSLYALSLPVNERPVHLESCGMEILAYIRLNIYKSTNENRRGKLYVPPGLVRELVTIDGIPGKKIWLKANYTSPGQLLTHLHEGLRARRLL